MNMILQTKERTNERRQDFMAQVPKRETAEGWVVPDYSQIWKQEGSCDSISDKRHQLKQFDCLGGVARAVQGGSMTKPELIKALEGLPDDTRIYIPSIEVAGDIMPASYVQVDYVGDGGIVKVLIIGARE